MDSSDLYKRLFVGLYELTRVYLRAEMDRFTFTAKFAQLALCVNVAAAPHGGPELELTEEILASLSEFLDEVDPLRRNPAVR